MMFTAKYLSDLIQTEQDANAKKMVTINFYDLCYIQPRLGALLLEDSFEIRDDYFKSCYFVADLLKVDRNSAQELIDNYCAELCFRALGKLFYEEANINSETREVYLRLFSCDINSILIMLSDNGFERTKNAFLNSAEEKQLTSHINYEYVVNLFEQFNKSQDKVATITFGKPL